MSDEELERAIAAYKERRAKQDDPYGYEATVSQGAKAGTAWFSTVAGRGGGAEKGRSVNQAFIPYMLSRRTRFQCTC